MTALLLVTLALAGSDARLLPFGADDLGLGARRPSLVYTHGSWYRYTCGDGGIYVQMSADGSTWSTSTMALGGDVCEPSVIAVGSGDYTWLMAYSYPDPDVGSWIGVAGSTDGITFTTIPDDHPTCYGPCGAPTLLHVGEYFILDHTEHTSDFDGMRVHHSTDGGMSWSSGLTHTLPDGADDPDIIYTPSAWYLVSKDPTSDRVHVWSAPKIEGDKTAVGVMVGVGQPAFYRSEGGAGLGTEPRTLWVTDGATRARMAIVDAEDGAEPPDASCTTGAMPGTRPTVTDGPANDGAFVWELPGPDVCTVEFPVGLDGADFAAVTALQARWDGVESVEIQLDDVSLGVQSVAGELPVSGIGEVQTLTLALTTSAASTFSLYLVAPTGEGSFPGGDADTDADTDDDTQDDSGPPADQPRCGCATSEAGDWVGLAAVGILGLRRRRYTSAGR